MGMNIFLKPPNVIYDVYSSNTVFGFDPSLSH